MTAIRTHARGTRPWRQLTAHFREAGVAVRLVPSSNIAVCLQMTLDRLGIASLPVPMVESALADGRLVELDYPWRQDDLVFEARYDADTAPSYLREAAALAQEVARSEDGGPLSSG
jgi:DNA-binding transcriptional LysR family regulator